ncbi:MAG TPA: FkbM family methyltransferase [Opitutaceae bacterium]|nr:FkbM family methyltransferase [Opitutaceae bacterium]
MYNQETELLILEAVLPHVERTFIDVGAEKGAFSAWLAARGLAGFAFEPLEQHTPGLQKLAASASVQNFAYAIDAADGKRDFHLATAEDGTTLDYFHSLQALHDDKRVHHTRTVRVTCRSLGSLVREKALPAQVGILKIDTEGNDLRVMQGMPPLKAQVLMAEYFTEGLYAGWTDAAPGKLMAMADSLGYAHCLAVRRRINSLEWVTYQPLAFLPGEWGNLIFMESGVFVQSRAALSAVLAKAEQNVLSKMAGLQSICDERQALIKQLHEACEKLRTSEPRP